MLKKFRRKVTWNGRILRKQNGRLHGRICRKPCKRRKAADLDSGLCPRLLRNGRCNGVPAHDERDFEFAKVFSLPVKEVVKGGNTEEEAYTGDGEHVNSGFLNGLNKAEAIEK